MGRYKSPYSGCSISKCRIKNCTLRSHHQPTETVRTDRSSTETSSPNPTDLIRDLVSFPLFSDSTVDDAQFKNLFHQYLSFDMPRIVALMAPPPSNLSPKQNVLARQQGIGMLGTLEPVYFLLFVSMAHLLELIRREQLQPDRVSAKLYGQLMQVVREKLNDYKTSETPDLVLSVLALSSFDMSLGNYAAVESHRAALQHLVSHVGLPYLGRSLPYVLSWDRLIAAFLCKPPLYATMPDRKFIRSPTHPKKYGMGFELAQERLRLDPDAETLCFDVCRAVEIAEAEKWSFRPDRLFEPYNASEVQYLYHMREVVQNTCIILQARDLQNPERSQLIVFAAMIVQYLILGKNDLTWYSISAADRLYESLTRQDFDEVWTDNQDVLCWLMCLMIIVKPWKQHAFALRFFKDWVERRSLMLSDEDKERPWDVLCNPQDFMWSASEFDGKLAEALKDYKSSISSVQLRQVYDPFYRGMKTVVVSCPV